MSGGAATMGRPKAGSKKDAIPPDERVTIVNLKGSAEYAEWLESIHKKTHIPKSTLIRLGMAEWAAKNGHSRPPEL